MILKRESKHDYSSERDQGVIIRLAPSIIQTIAKSFTLVRDSKLSYVVKKLLETEHAGLVHHLPSTYLGARVQCDLCVSDQELWVQCKMESMWGEDYFQTEKTQLRQLIPVDLLSVVEKCIPVTIRSGSIQPYKKRLNALLDGPI